MQITNSVQSDVFCIWGYGGHVKDGDEERTMRENKENSTA